MNPFQDSRAPIASGHLVSHVNAPVADLPVLKAFGGLHFIADLTLPYGRALRDYLAEPPASIRG